MKAHKIPFDLVLQDYIKFCLEHDPNVHKIFSGGRSSVGSKLRAVFSNIIYNESIHLTLDDIAKSIGMACRTSVQDYHESHLESMKKDSEYRKLYQSVMVLTQMYRSTKEINMSEGIPFGDSGAGWDRYESDIIAKCYKTNAPIRYGDFVGGTTQGGNQFTAIPLLEISDMVLGVHNHKIKVPLTANENFDDVIILEKLRLDQRSPLEWRYVL